MEPEQSTKSTKKSEESVRRRLTKGEALQGSISSATVFPEHSSTQAMPAADVPSQPPFPTVKRKVGRPKLCKGPSFEHLHHGSKLQPQPLSPAFMSPGKPEPSLEGPTWQLIDPTRPGPSGSFASPGLQSHGQLIPSHTSIMPGEDLPSAQKVYVHRSSHVSLKSTEEVQKKEKKPQKPGKYICQYCSRPCAKPSVLQKHIRSHTGERPYPCIPCGFSFKTKSNLYKHRKSHAHRIKAGLASGLEAEMYPSSLDTERLGGEEFEEPTEGESTDSEEETSTLAGHLADLPARQKHSLSSCSSYGTGSQGTSHDHPSFSHSSVSQSLEEGPPFVEPSSERALSHKSEDTHSIKQKLALRLSERKKVIEEQSFLSPGSKGSTESGYFSRSESAEQQISPPNTNAKSYAEIIFGKCGRIGQKTATSTPQGSHHEDKTSIPLSVPRTQVIEHITKLITINEAVVDTSEIDSVKPRRSSLSRRSSIESPKAGTFRDPFQFDIKSSGASSHLDPSRTLSSQGEKNKPEQSFLSLHPSHSATETVPLLRSHSMPSAACTISSLQAFRASYSLDNPVMESDVVRRSHAFSSHPRMLKRQPAIELPMGMEYSSEEIGSISKDVLSKPVEQQEPPKDIDPTKKSRRGPKMKGLMYECNICGARYKKRDNYEAHKKYYCSELQMPMPQSAGPHAPSETRKGLAEQDTLPHVMHYKIGSGLELAPLRKRRKEKSIGDDEDPPGYVMTKPVPSSRASLSQFAGPVSCDAALCLATDTITSPAEASEIVPLADASMDITSRDPAMPLTGESKERRTTSKEISVIQHTSSFEKSESMEQLSGLEEEDNSAAQSTSQPATQHTRSSLSLQSRLVRQPNIQVPEILVTEEPDRPEFEPEPPPKEQEKTEEFQWPQRSQTLSQLPAEKLPPKKKRLRLAEMSQSSGESSFESGTLTRSPSQESSISHASSHSVSFEREEHNKQETAGPSLEALVKPFGAHMLTVPTQPHHVREMRRSASEQTPNVSHTAQIAENRSKSFDYGSLSSAPSSGTAAASSAQEKRKCFQTRQASLSRHLEHDPDALLKGWREVDEQLSSSSKHSAKGTSHSPPSSSHGEPRPDKGLLKDSPHPVYTQPLSEALQVFHPQIPQLALHDKPYLPLFPVQHLLQQPELFSAQAMSELISAQFPFPQIPPSLFQTPQLPLQQALLHPSQLQITQQPMPHPMEMPFRQHPPFFPMHYAGSSPIPSAFFLPLPPQFALQLPTEISDPLPQSKPVFSPPVGTSSLSPSKESSLQSLALSTSPPMTESTSQIVARSDPVMSLVVPVRIQTHMPSYGSAMYTTLSQILVTQSHCSPSSLFIRKFDDSRPKGVHGVGFDLAQMITEDQRSLFQTPYLRVPLPAVERRGFMPLTSASESDLGPDGSTATVGGSKRMLSPAGSLELTMEAQQQKRVKEEVVFEPDEKVDLLKSASAALANVEEGTRQDKSKFAMQGQCRAEVDLPFMSSSDQSTPKEIPSCLQPTSHSDSLEDYKQPVGKQYRSKLPLHPVKKEDSKELTEQPPCSPMSTAPPPAVTLSAMSSAEGTDVKKGLQYPSLHTTTNVSWCYLNYIKPNHIQQTDRRSSVYAGWCISLYNPNLPGVSTKAALSLLRSKQKLSKEIYTTATAPRPETGRLVTSSVRKPKMSEVHLPAQHSSDGRKEAARAEKDDEKRGKQEEEPTASKRGLPARIRIFEGGYKSNEEYVYVRGRGRGKYVCEECGIRCKKPSMLKKHIRTHTDVRPYVCKYCNFAFKTKGNLTKHMKSKAHSKKCQEMGVLVSLPLDLEADEGTSEELFQDSEGREGSEAVEEHQFSDLDVSDDDDDDDEDDDDDDDDENDDEEDDNEEEESQEEQSLKSVDIKHPYHQMHFSGAPSSQEQIAGATSLSKLDIGSRCQPTAAGHLATSSKAEAKLSIDSGEIPTCQRVPALHRPFLTSSEHLSSTERELVTRQQMFLGMDLSTSKDTSPRRRWSSSKGPVLSRRYLLTKNETSPKRFSPTGEISSLRCSSPGRRMSPCQRVSPGRDVSPLRCVSPSRHMSPRTDLSPRAYISPERGLSPVHHLPASREIASVRYSSLRKILSPCESESPSRYPSPGNDEMPGSSRTATDVKAQRSFKVERGLTSSLALPQKSHGKNTEIRDSKMKLEPGRSHEGSACSPSNMLPVYSRPFPAAHELHVYNPPRVEENVFSHLPLHSQQLTRAPYPMIPIGGIQMVQSRPGSHPVLVPGSVVSLQAGYLTGSGSFTEYSASGTHCTERRDVWEASSAPASQATSASRFSPQTKSCSPRQEKSRTSELQLKTEQEEYREKEYAETQHSEQKICPDKAISPSADPEQLPKPSSANKPLKQTGKTQCGNLSTFCDSPCTFISDCPAQTLDRSSSTGCLVEPSPSHSHSDQFSVRRRHLSSDPSHCLGMHRKGTPQPEIAGLGQAKKLEGGNTG